MRNLRLKRVVWFSFVFCFLLPLEAFASVVFNEVAWMGIEMEGIDSKNWWRYEWIELYNAGGQEADIAGWRIENGAAKNEDLVISAGKIPARGYFLICKTEIGNCDLLNSKMSLHNEYNKNGALVLKGTQGNTIDATPEASGKEWPGGDNETKQTMERRNPLISGTDIGNWQTSQEPNGTPKAQNSIFAAKSISEPAPEPEPEPLTTTTPETTTEATTTEPATTTTPTSEVEPQIVKYPGNIFINEILPSAAGPDAENEWIELYNANDFEVVLFNWQIRDKIGQTMSYLCPTDTKIVPFGFFLVRRTESKITLQNSGDTLELLNPNNEIVHTVSYPKALLGQSYNRTATGWSWSTTLTPEKPNIITQPEIPKSENLEMSKSQNIEISEKETGPRPSPSPTTTLLADIFSELPEKSNRLLILLFAFVIAIGSAIIVLFLKRKVETENGV